MNDGDNGGVGINNTIMDRRRCPCNVCDKSLTKKQQFGGNLYLYDVMFLRSFTYFTNLLDHGRTHMAKKP